MTDIPPGHSDYRRWEYFFMAALLVVALALRITYVVQVQSNPFFEHPRLDALFHDEWAKSIAAGNIMGDRVFFRAPLYPYLLGAVYGIAGHNYLAPRILQHLLGAISVVLVFVLTRRLFGSAAAVGSSCLFLLYAIVLYFEGELLFDSFLTFLCLAWAVVMEKGAEKLTVGRWLLGGFVYGLICITRPPFLALAIPLFGILLWNAAKGAGRTRALRMGMALVLGLSLPILPVAIRNYLMEEDIVLIASQGGVNFYIGNNPSADGFSSSMPGTLGASWENRDATHQVEQAIGHPPTPSEESWFWYKKGFSFILDEPGRFLMLLVKKTYLFWNWYEIPNNQSFQSFQQYSSLLRFLPVGFWLVGPLGLFGMMLAWQLRTARLWVIFVLSYAALITLFFVCDRYRLPVVPLLCMFAGYALVELVGRIRAGDLRWLARRGPFLLFSAVLVNISLIPIAAGASGARDALTLGMVALDRGSYDEALAHFDRAMSLQPDLPNLHLNRGVAEWLKGDTLRAHQMFHEELRYHPTCYGALSNLSLLHLSERRLDSVHFYGRGAMALKPYLPVGYIVVAQAYQLEGNLEEAAGILALGMKKCGNDFLYGEYLLAGISMERGNVPAADSLYRSILHRLLTTPQPAYEPEFGYSAETRMGMDRGSLRARLLYGLGHVHVAHGRVDSAAFCFQSAVLVQPSLADAWADLGVAFLQLGRLEEADSAFVHAVTLNPKNALYWYNYGTLLGTSGRLTEARDAFEKTLLLRPDFVPAREKLALTIRAMEQPRRQRLAH